ncbi:regulatory protein RecX [Parapedobacter lycopersici]|uniref:regulatory protein RecX n=1 Tax=Parapedobacter lycopersici TaxID=1864939 RepID=UPI00214D5B7D|nr:regulatory protein RecX [Parapedobacter lycopersici]
MDDAHAHRKQVLTPAQARSKAESYCAYQERSQQEVRDKLYSWGLHRTDVEATIAELIADNFLNEERFAMAYVSGKFNVKRWGKLKIRQGLITKAVSKPLITVALNSIDDAQYRLTLQHLLQKKAAMLSTDNPYKRKHQLLQYAAGKGYENSVILEILSDNEL